MPQYVQHFLEDQLDDGVLSGIGWSAALQDVNLRQASSRFLGDRCAIITPSLSTRIGIRINATSSDAARADAEVRSTIEFTAMGTGNSCAIAVVREAGIGSASDRYTAELRGGANTIAITKQVGATPTTIVSTAFTFALNTLYSFVFQVSGTNLKLKVWAEGTPEPAAWTLTTTDSAISAAGDIRVGAFNAATSPTVNVWYLSVGTGTSASPARPVSWAEYLAFNDLQDAMRCVLIEADLLGQDSSGSALTARVCMSNMPFVSKAMDTYPHICYEEILLDAPQVRRRLGTALIGKTTIGYGDIAFKNEVVTAAATLQAEIFVGRLDAWKTWNWDGRPARMLAGHPTWRRCDFKTSLLGTVQDIAKTDYGQLSLKLRGLEALFQRAMYMPLIGGSGPNANAQAPITFSDNFFNVSPPVYDPNTLQYLVKVNTFGALNKFFDDYPVAHEVRDAGGSLKKGPLTVSSVNTGTDTITFGSSHGLVVGATIVFPTGPLPSPLVVNTKYYVKTAPNGTDVTLSATSGGATIDLTTSTAGGIAYGFLYDWTAIAGTMGGGGWGVIPLSTPQGQITTDLLPNGAEGGVSAAVKQAIINSFGPGAVMHNNYPVGAPRVDIFHGQTLTQNVLTWDRTQASRGLGEKVDAMVMSVGASWCFAREGTYYLFALDVPGAPTAGLPALGPDDIRNWRDGVRNLPRNVERLGYKANPTIQQGGDLVGSVSVANRDLYGKPYSLAAGSVSGAGLDGPWNHLLAETPPERATLLENSADATAESTRIYSLYRKVTGTFVFSTGGWALTAELGDVVNITNPHEAGFENGKNVTIVGITENAARGTAELEVFCQIDGQWPIVSSANPFVPETYY